MARAKYSVTGEESESVEIDNLLQQNQENPNIRRPRPDSNNGKNKLKRRAEQYFFKMFMGISAVLFLLVLISLSVGLFAAIDGKFRNDDLKKILNEQNKMKKELDSLKKEVLSQQTKIERLETALAEKEKQYNELSETVFIHFSIC